MAARFPQDGVLGEEEGLDEGTSGRVWVVDPVDGTKLYAEGIPLWTTLIALQVEGEPRLGIADVPALRERYHAVRGGGAWRDDRRLAVSEVGAIGEAFVAHSPVEEWLARRARAAAARAGRGASAARGA